MPDNTEQVAIDRVRQRLSSRYAQAAPDQVSNAVQDALARFSNSSVRDFVPLLVERKAGEQLETLAS
ncbi:hypothetical protein OG921_24825 [Aldersonia sp. NBC_00410]|uniref:three-helix bundle dimerization domain-containing protein n=1 Tax=Aldersonia sp. NBC_00410 TaxID=2975954 RepID=UPI00224F0BEC|nr:hypothetical protein [Aldersonia sp. NBC_00410]MCX5046401.1 hypothetical protein [Aldersonia sp. NBC_00410]